MVQVETLTLNEDKGFMYGGRFYLGGVKPENEVNGYNVRFINIAADIKFSFKLSIHVPDIRVDGERTRPDYYLVSFDFINNMDICVTTKHPEYFNIIQELLHDSRVVDSYGSTNLTDESRAYAHKKFMMLLVEIISLETFIDKIIPEIVHLHKAALESGSDREKYRIRQALGL